LALDRLTKLYNGRSGEQRLAEQSSRAVRHEFPLTLLVVDLDGMKQINTQFGRAAVGLVVARFAERLGKAHRGF
jgi:diguanylate cyclase (GGDEF)-like protein